MGRIFESHAHYDDEAYDADREQLLSSLPLLPDFPIGIAINAGANVERSIKAAALAEGYDYIYSSAGVHPHDVESLDESGMATLDELCRKDKTVSVGEIGLDYYRDLSPRNLQREWFIRQIELAFEHNLPLIVHSREADADTFDIIKETNAKKVGGVIHCFSGSAEMAAEYVKLGFYIGVGGVVTYKNARRLVEVVEKTPIERILLETDCPYLSPEPRRGKRNDSGSLGIIAAKIAEIKGISVEEVVDTTFENGLSLFRIKV